MLLEETTMIATEHNLSTVIRERHSVRKYDPNFKISQEEIKDILSEATLAPSSSNMQPWKFMVIQDEETKKELRAIANNQEQVETSSAVIAVLGDKEMYKNAEKIFQQSHEAGLVDQETMERMIENTTKLYSSAPAETRTNIATFDAGLLSMQLMLIAKARGYDTVTMGGFNKQKFAERFEVSERYFPIVLIALGKAAASGRQTTRLPIEDVISFV
jgi:nitroreductase